MSGYHWLYLSKTRQTILLQWCDLTSSCDGSTSSGDRSIAWTVSNTIKMIWHKIAFHLQLMIDINIYIYIYIYINMRDRSPKSWLYTAGFPGRSGRVGGQNVLLMLAPLCFLWNNLWPVCRYIISNRLTPGHLRERCHLFLFRDFWIHSKAISRSLVVAIFTSNCQIVVNQTEYPPKFQMKLNRHQTILHIFLNFS